MNFPLVKKVLLGVAFLNILPPVVLFVMSKSEGFTIKFLGGLTAIHEFLLSLVVGILLANVPRGHSWKRFLIISFLAIGIGDLMYGLFAYFIRIAPPRGLWPLFHEIPYTTFAIFSSIAIFFRATEDLGKQHKKVIAFLIIVFSTLFFTVSHRMILQPFFAAAPSRPDLIYLTASVYALGQSVFFASLIIASLRALSFVEFFFYFAFMTLVSSDFVLRFQDIGKPIPELSFFEYGWHFSLAVLFCLTLTDYARHSRISFFDKLSSLKSVRVVTAAITLFTLSLFVSATWIFEAYLGHATPSNVASYFVLCCFIWAFANLVSLGISRMLAKDSTILRDQIMSISSLADFNISDKGPQELLPIAQSLEDLKERLLASESSNLKLASRISAAEVAVQVAHDIRAPLSALQIATSTGTGQASDMGLILAATQRIKKIADGLLTEYKNEPIRESYRVSDSIKQVVDEKSLAGNRKIQVIIKEDFNLIANESRFQRAVSNFLDNALQAGDGDRPNEVVVTIDGGTVVISDTGKGMENQTLRDLKDGILKSSKPGGHGLGFRGSRQMLQEEGLTVDVQTVPGAGTSIVIQRSTSQQSPI